ncbi:MAG: antitoxin component of MazEF toxin-antitoxin module [Verrucomicrobiales bacterium]|jgi:antitoxin component of MazEF toxin-antitoxin module
MIKTLRKQGNGHVLPLDKATLEAMGITIDTPLQLSLTGNSLVVTPLNVGVADAQLDQSLEKMRNQFGKALKNLAK